MSDKDLFAPPVYQHEAKPISTKDLAIGLPTLREVIKQTIVDRYIRLRRNKTETAKSLGIAKASMYRRLNEYDIL